MTPTEALADCLAKTAPETPYYLNGSVLIQEVPVPFVNGGTAQRIIGEGMTAEEIYAHFRLAMPVPEVAAETDAEGNKKGKRN